MAVSQAQITAIEAQIAGLLTANTTLAQRVSRLEIQVIALQTQLAKVKKG